MGAPVGMPMSTTRTVPLCDLPGLIHSPGLAAAKVAVARARIAAPSTTPLAASTPLGTSAATIGRPASLSASMASATAPCGVPEKPVPSRASTATEQSARRATSNGSTPSTRSALVRASPLSSLSGATASTRTARPASRSRRAAT
jgi:hypothetical protein